MLNILNYKLYKHAWIDKCAPHHGEKLNQDDIRFLLSNGGVMVRNTYDFDCKEETSFWYVIKDSFEGMEELSSRCRGKVRRSLKTYDVRRVSAQELLAVGLPIYQEACKSYKVKADIITKQQFEDRIASCEKAGNTDFWCLYDRTTCQAVALAINTVYGDCCEYNTLKCKPSAMRNSTYPYYGLIYEMNRYYLEELKLKYVNDGARSITEHSNIQPFLIDTFHFRKAYCKLQVEYKWWMRVLITFLYPFRSKILYLPIRSLLRMESFARLSKNTIK